MALFSARFSKVFVFNYPLQKRSGFKMMRFPKAPYLKPFNFSSAFSVVLVWTIGENVSTRLRKRIMCGGHRLEFSLVWLSLHVLLPLVFSKCNLYNFPALKPLHVFPRFVFVARFPEPRGIPYMHYDFRVLHSWHVVPLATLCMFVTWFPHCLF